MTKERDQIITALEAELTQTIARAEGQRLAAERLAIAGQKVENALGAIIDYKEMSTVEFVDTYAPGLNWGDMLSMARSAMREWQAALAAWVEDGAK